MGVRRFRPEGATGRGGRWLCHRFRTISKKSSQSRRFHITSSRAPRTPNIGCNSGALGSLAFRAGPFPHRGRLGLPPAQPPGQRAWPILTPLVVERIPRSSRVSSRLSPLSHARRARSEWNRLQPLLRRSRARHHYNPPPDPVRGHRCAYTRPTLKLRMQPNKIT